MVVQILRLLFIPLIIIMIALMLPEPANALTVINNPVPTCDINTQEIEQILEKINNSTAKKELELIKEMLAKEISPKVEQPNNQLNSFLLGAIGSFTGVGGLMLIGWGAKRLFPTLEVKELKERIEVLETIVTKE